MMMTSSPPPRGTRPLSIPFNLNTPPTPSRNHSSPHHDSAAVSHIIQQGERDLSNFQTLREAEYIKALDRTEKARASLFEKLEAATADFKALAAKSEAREQELLRLVREYEGKAADLERREREAMNAHRDEAARRAALAEELALSKRLVAQLEADLKETKSRNRHLEEQQAESSQRSESRIAQLEDEKRAIIDQAEAKTLALIEALRQVQTDVDELKRDKADGLLEDLARPRDDFLSAAADRLVDSRLYHTPMRPYEFDEDKIVARLPTAWLPLVEQAERLPSIPPRGRTSRSNGSVDHAKRRVQRVKKMLDW